MNISMNVLENPRKALMGFNISITISLGDIMLSVFVRLVNMMFKHFSYNVILGRAFIHDMKIIPSTYHQKVSYLTIWEQIVIFRDQMSLQ